MAGFFFRLSGKKKVDFGFSGDANAYSMAPLLFHSNTQRSNLFDHGLPDRLPQCISSYVLDDDSDDDALPQRVPRILSM